MKRGAPPYVPWFHGDFLRSTAGWTPMERFTYWMLLCAQHEMGVLPSDMGRLAAIAGIDPDTMNTVWPVVGKKFKRTKSGLLNVRMEAHRSNYLEYRRHQIESGRKGAEMRWRKPGKVVPFPTQEARRD